MICCLGKETGVAAVAVAVEDMWKYHHQPCGDDETPCVTSRMAER